MQVNGWIYFLLAFLLLMVAELLYFKIADSYNIIDKPNQRSSHRSVVLRGGGIVFSLAVLIYEILNSVPHPYFLVGLVIIATVSFLDDIRPLKASLRFVCQLVGVFLLMVQLQFRELPVIVWLITAVMLIGILNAWNFMDGINGITVGISLLTIVTLFYINTQLDLYDSNFFIWIIASLLVFSFFNVRKQARCFAGDIGSIGIAYIILFILVNVLITTRNPLYLLLLAVYGVDSVITIFQRLLKKENIFLPHRQHLYQYLANELHWPHLKVSAIYTAVQLCINIFMFQLLKWQDESMAILVAIVLLVTLIAVYLIVKRNVLRKSISIR